MNRASGPGWERVTPLDAAGRRATWMRISKYPDSTIRTLEICSGREGDDWYVAFSDPTTDQDRLKGLYDVLTNVQWFYQRDADSELKLPAHLEILRIMREKGWRVAVHNDYEQDGELCTFWLFTHKESGRFLKGEGRTDEEAMAQVFAEALST